MKLQVISIGIALMSLFTSCSKDSEAITPDNIESENSIVIESTGISEKNAVCNGKIKPVWFHILDANNHVQELLKSGELMVRYYGYAADEVDVHVPDIEYGVNYRTATLKDPNTEPKMHIRHLTDNSDFYKKQKNPWGVNGYLASYRTDGDKYRYHYALMIDGERKEAQWPKWNSCSGKVFNKNLTKLAEKATK